MDGGGAGPGGRALGPGFCFAGGHPHRSGPPAWAVPSPTLLTCPRGDSLAPHEHVWRQEALWFRASHATGLRAEAVHVRPGRRGPGNRCPALGASPPGKCPQWEPGLGWSPGVPSESPRSSQDRICRALLALATSFLAFQEAKELGWRSFQRQLSARGRTRFHLADSSLSVRASSSSCVHSRAAGLAPG